MAETIVQTRLSSLRKRRGLSVAELAHAVGVTRQSIHAIESGAYIPNTAVALKLGSILDASVEDMFVLDEPNAPEVETLESSFLGDKRPSADQPIRLCPVGDSLVAVPLEVAGSHLPDADGVVVGTTGHGWLSVRPFHGAKRQNSLIIAGCDPAVTILGRGLTADGVELVPWNCNSSQSLELLRQGRIHVAGCHLPGQLEHDGDRSLIQSLFQPGEVSVITFATWEQGIVVAPGNPKDLRQIADLARPGLRLVNREEGSGSRLLLDRLLERAGISGASISGYTNAVSGHMAVARAVAQGEADCGIATNSAARALGLGFIPLTSERYDFVIRQDQLTKLPVRICLELINRAKFHALLSQYAGYDVRLTGQLV